MRLKTWLTRLSGRQSCRELLATRLTTAGFRCRAFSSLTPTDQRYIVLHLINYLMLMNFKCCSLCCANFVTFTLYANVTSAVTLHSIINIFGDTSIMRQYNWSAAVLRNFSAQLLNLPIAISLQYSFKLIAAVSVCLSVQFLVICWWKIDWIFHASSLWYNFARSVMWC